MALVVGGIRAVSLLVGVYCENFSSLLQGLHVKKETESSLGARLRSVRDELGVSQGDMASACGVSREMWGRYERGAATPSAEVLSRAAIQGADVAYALTGVRSDPAVVQAFQWAAEATRTANVPEESRRELWASLVNGMQKHGDQEQQRRLLAAWERCAPPDRDALLRMAESLSRQVHGGSNEKA